MKKVFIAFYLILLLISPATAESRISYLFRGGQSLDLVFEQTLDVLRTYHFAIYRLNQSEGMIETEYELIKRKAWYDYNLKYEIQIREYQGRIRMDVVAIVFEEQWKGSQGEIKSAWWLVKQVVRRIGK